MQQKEFAMNSLVHILILTVASLELLVGPLSRDTLVADFLNMTKEAS